MSQINQIRSIKTEDIPHMLGIYAYYVENTPVTLEKEPPTLDLFRERVEHLSENAPFLVYESDGRILGYAQTACSEEPGDHWTFESSVYVDHSERGRGIGSALYAKLFELLRDQGVVNVFASITLPNEASVRLHERFGFSPIGVSRKIGFKQGEWWDVQWLQLRLQDLGEPKVLLPPERNLEVRL